MQRLLNSRCIEPFKHPAFLRNRIYFLKSLRIGDEPRAMKPMPITVIPACICHRTSLSDVPSWA